MAAEEKKEDASLRFIIGDPKKMKPPSKKKLEEELESTQSQIKDKEMKYEKLKASSNEIKNVEYERKAAIDHRKRIVIELEKLNRDIPEKMRRLNELKSSLVYKSEDKINNAISRLEWNLNAKTFKLTEEKKIVSEIDRLKRSKKTLVQYQTLEQEINGIRDRQRAMRDERDRYSRTITQLKAEEDAMRQDYHKSKFLKQEIDDLYEQKRQLVASFKRQKEEFKDVKDKQRKESMKKKEEERRAIIKVKRKERIEMEAEKLPHADELHLCQTLITYLSRFGPSMQDAAPEGLSPASSQGQSEDPEPAEEMDDGQFVLLRKTDENEDLDFSVGLSRNRRRNRRSRKQSMIKKITHSTDVLSQFMTLNLNAPSSLSEVAEAIEELKKKRAFYEREQQMMESASDAGFSLTESMMCEMSRQASKTESYEGGSQENVRPDESVYTDLLEACKDESVGLHSGCDELLGAVGGVPESEGSDSATPKSGSQNSDSTVEGEASSQGAQVFVNPPILRAADSVESSQKKKLEQKKSLSPQSNIPSPAPWLLGASTALPETGSSHNFLAVPKTESALGPRADCQVLHQPLQKTRSLQPSSPSANPDIKSYAHSVVSRSRSFSGVLQCKKSPGFSSQNQSQKPSPPSSLLLSVPLSSSLNMSSSTKRPLTRSKTMMPTGGNPWKERGAWNVKGETSKLSGIDSLSQDRRDYNPLSPSPSMSHALHSPLSSRLSYPLPSDSPMALQTTTAVLDQDFPPLSHTTNPSRRSSNFSSKSSNESQSCVDIPHDTATGKLCLCSTASLSKNIQQPPPGATIRVLQDSDFSTLQAGSVSLSLLPSVNPVPGKGKTDTELWVESSMAFVQDEVIEPEKDSHTQESTRL